MSGKSRECGGRAGGRGGGEGKGKEAEEWGRWEDAAGGGGVDDQCEVGYVIVTVCGMVQMTSSTVT